MTNIKYMNEEVVIKKAIEVLIKEKTPQKMAKDVR
jgi:hypothetical protein